MKKVFIIADEFPPVGGAGVQRTLKFTKYLQKFNFLPYIFTRDTNNILLKDDSLLLEVPSNVEVFRTKSYDFQHKSNIFYKALYYKLLIPDGRFIWYLLSRKKMVKEIKRINPQIIYSTSFPYSSHLLALYAQKKFKDIMWVADFRDEWTNNPYFNHNSFRSFIEKRLEKKVLKNANKLITNTPIMMDNFIKSHPFTKDKFTVISNGFDPTDYGNLLTNKKKNEIFTITYTGSLYGRRKPDTFLIAYGNLINNGKIDKNKVMVNFIGNIKKENIIEFSKRLHILENVNLISYLSHKECIKKLSQSDVSLLIEGKGKGSNAFYTGKIFEYMYLDNPILGVIPKKGAAANLIRETNTGIVCDFDNIGEIEEAILMLYNNWKNNEVNSYSSEKNIDKYNRINLTEKLIDIFNSIL